jgi:glucose/arabinose dehydrogenase
MHSRFVGRALVLSLVSLCASAAAGPPVAPTEPLTPAEQKAKFKLPAGFEIQLVASEPDIQKPMNLAFDAKGRLWVSHSIEYPFAAADPEKARDGLTVLEGIGPDGKAASAKRFADGLNIPIGVLPLPSGNEVIVWSTTTGRPTRRKSSTGRSTSPIRTEIRTRFVSLPMDGSMRVTGSAMRRRSSCVVRGMWFSK